MTLCGRKLSAEHKRAFHEGRARKWRDDSDYRARLVAAFKAASTKCWQSDEEIAELRRQRFTLQQIASRFGITRERVRQRLKRYGDPGLIGFAAPVHVTRRQQTIERLTRVCENCGASFVAQAASPGRFCSRRCSQVAPHTQFCARAEKIIASRRQGMTWAQAWIAAGYNGDGNLANFARMTVIRYAESENVDISDIFGWSPNSRQMLHDRKGEKRARKTGAPT